AAGASSVLPVCGPAFRFDDFAAYPVTAFSWALGDGNPTLAEVHQRTGRAVVGGLPAKPEIATLSAKAIAARARRAIDQMGGRALLLGPDCSINPDTPDDLLHAAAAVARQ